MAEQFADLIEGDPLPEEVCRKGMPSMPRSGLCRELAPAQPFMGI
jgi:hypothetical protein